MITIYGKTNCAACTTAKNILEAKGIEFEYKMLNTDYGVEELMDVCLRLGIRGTSFPIVVALDQQLSIEELQAL